MSSVVSTKAKRISRITNYAILNRKGLMNARLVKTKRMRPKGASSVPNTPDSMTRVLQKVVKELDKVPSAKKLGQTQKVLKQQIVNILEHSQVYAPTLALTPDRYDTCQDKEKNGKKVQKGAKSSDHEHLLNEVICTGHTDMSNLQLEGLSREEKKWVLRVSITQLEAEEEEEDKELKQLLAKHASLH